MLALYLTYNVDSGEILGIQVQRKGVAWKVADYPRGREESVVRYSVDSLEELLDMHLLCQGELDDDRSLLVCGEVVLREHRGDSVREVKRIQDEKFVACSSWDD